MDRREEIMELIISSILTLFIVVQIILINVFKKDRQAIFTGLISLVSIGFGVFLLVWSEALGYESDIEIANVSIHYQFGLANFYIGLVFVVVSIIKFIVLKIKLSLK